MSVFCGCCVLSGRGLCQELIPRPEESYRLWCVTVCDVETLRMRRPWPALGCCDTEKSLRHDTFSFLRHEFIRENNDREKFISPYYSYNRDVAKRLQSTSFA